MKRYLVPTKRASRGVATSPTTGEAARDRTVKAARPVDENMLADGIVEAGTSSNFRDREQEAAHPRLQERGRPSRALISVASGDLSLRFPPAVPVHSERTRYWKLLLDNSRACGCWWRRSLLEE